ncbi:adenosylcobinamide-phosphate synthase CbiB [Hoeflea poritis]|uniref:Cobalamin biosynthesis protein CobD n=1 Tax=Hoeflea poritis TaxID=2993659 RepID=A0ABT4VKV4_9HYPH|nr:adenosylcobinamide-phosphate synthase CbiB [Hoeflea poritis]MDA4844658.1 adenosylcobinamide-phosphate synthase CbiB [Hoeflea poritis]
MHLAILTVALLADRFMGDPQWLWERFRHPVVLFGSAIDLADRLGNRSSESESIRRRNGLIAILILLLLAIAIGWVLSRIFEHIGAVGFVLEVAVVTVLLAQKSLGDHVVRVAEALRNEGLAGGRDAVSRIVGRDPDSLDEDAICRAAIESLAENFSDGVVAPALWYAVFGLPGILLYKMLNTADSMIGHKNERYRDFGRASARLDDLANWPAARLSALLIAGGAFSVKGWRAAKRAVDVALRDAALHRSPNAGWPECAMAGALDLALAGARVYGGEIVREPFLNAAGRRQAEAADIDTAVKVFYTACAVLTGLSAVLFLLL